MSGMLASLEPLKCHVPAAMVLPGPACVIGDLLVASCIYHHCPVGGIAYAARYQQYTGRTRNSNALTCYDMQDRAGS